MEQGTIRDFDPASRSGTLLTDERAEVAIDEGSLAGAEILNLRIGQRVKFEVVDADDRRVARTLRIVTFD